MSVVPCTIFVHHARAFERALDFQPPCVRAKSAALVTPSLVCLPPYLNLPTPLQELQTTRIRTRSLLVGKFRDRWQAALGREFIHDPGEQL
jgi:hypothetical protein